MRRMTLLMVVALGLVLGCSDVEATEAPENSSPEESNDSVGSGGSDGSATETIDPDVLAGRILTVQGRVLGFAKRAGQWQDLPMKVRRAYNRLDRLLANGTVGPREYAAATRNLGVLQRAIGSGQLKRVVAREKAKRQRKQGGSSVGGSDCMSGYSPCLPIRGDLNCPDVVAMGRAPVRVTGSDPYGLDGDNDGVGCE